MVNTLSDPTGTFIDGPCGLAINLGFFESQIFVSNLLNGSVWRLDVGVDGKRGLTIENAVRVGNGYGSTVILPGIANGPAGLAYDPRHDILYVASEVDNEIFAIDHASRISVISLLEARWSITTTFTAMGPPACCCLATVTC